MADTTLLNQNITLLTQALQRLNQDMFQKTGGRSSMWGPNVAIPGTSTKIGAGVNGEDKNAQRIISANMLLNATMNKNSDAIKYFIKNQDKSMKDLGKYSEYSGKYLATAIKDFSAKQLDVALPKLINKQLDAAITSGLISPLKNFDDVVKHAARSNLENLEAGKKYYEQINALNANSSDYAKAYDALQKKIELTGFKFEELAGAVKNGDAALRAEVAERAKASAGTAIKLKQVDESFDLFKGTLKVLGGLASGLGGELYKATIAAEKYGTEVTASTVVQAAYAGMTSEDLIKVQNENIQAIHSSGMTFDDFNKKLDNGASKLFQFTGHLEDGARITASSVGTFRSLSNNTDQLDGFIQQQQEQFAKLNRTMGMTSEQFVQLNSDLLNSQSVQVQMYKLTKEQRVAAQQSLIAQYEKLRVDGLSEEQAKKVVDAFAQLTGGKAQDRIVQAAKVQGIFGALGLGAQGTRAAELIRKGQRGTTSDEKKELEEILKNAQRSVSSKYGQANIAGELQLDKLTEVIEGVLGPNSQSAALATSQGKEITQQTAGQLQQTRALDGLTKIGQDQINWAMRQYQAFDNGLKPIKTAVEGILALMIGDKFWTGFKNILKGVGPTAGGAGGGLLEEIGLGSAALASVPVGLIASATTAAITTLTAGNSLINLFTGQDASNFISDLEQSAGGAISGTLTSLFGDNNTYNPQAGNLTSITGMRNKKIAADREQIENLTNGPQTSDTAKQIQVLNDEITKLVDLQKKHLEETKKLTNLTQQGINQQAAQTDDHIEATKQIVEKRNTHPTVWTATSNV